MLQLEVLILKLVAVDGLATSTIMVGEISTLAHELRDDAMESGSLVGHAILLAGAESSEILGCAGNHVSAKLTRLKQTKRLQFVARNDYALCMRLDN